MNEGNEADAPEVNGLTFTQLHHMIMIAQDEAQRLFYEEREAGNITQEAFEVGKRATIRSFNALYDYGQVMLTTHEDACLRIARDTVAKLNKRYPRWAVERGPIEHNPRVEYTITFILLGDGTWLHTSHNPYIELVKEHCDVERTFELRFKSRDEAVLYTMEIVGDEVQTAEKYLQMLKQTQ